MSGLAYNPHSQHSHRRIVALGLVVLLLAMQSTLTYLVTPMASQDSDTGKVTIMLCTLQGMQEVTIDLGMEAASGENHCPALDLHKLVATGVVDLSGQPAALIPPTTLQLYPRPTPDHRSENYPAFSGRAPPLV